MPPHMHSSGWPHWRCNCFYGHVSGNGSTSRFWLYNPLHWLCSFRIFDSPHGYIAETNLERPGSSNHRCISAASALREPPFILFWWLMLLVFACLYVPYFYIEVFSVRVRIFTSEDVFLNRYLIVFMNTGSLFGRLVGTEFGSVFSECCTLTQTAATEHPGGQNRSVEHNLAGVSHHGIVAFCWSAVSTKADLITFCVFYGFFSGSLVALMPVVWEILSPNPKVMGTRTGMLSVSMAAGLLIGNPVAGALVRRYGFLALQSFCGSMIIAGGLVLLAGRWAQNRHTLAWKI